MAHELEIIDGVASMAYNVQNGVPWHRLGTPMEGLQSLDEMLRAANADYEVDTFPVFAYGPDGEPVEIPNRFVTGRIVNDELEPFEVVSQKYHVVSNRPVGEKALAIASASGGDAVIDTAGVLFGGRKFFMTIDLGSLVIDPNGVADEIGRYLNVTTTHDGKEPITFSQGDIRQVCQNTCRFALENANAVFKARHTSGVEGNIEEAKTVLGLSTQWTEAFTEMANQLLAMPATTRTIDVAFEALWPEGDADTDRKKRTRDERRGEIQVIYQNDRNAKVLGNNRWAVYNAFTEYFDWHRSGKALDRAVQAMDPMSLASQRKEIVGRVLSAV